MENKITFFHLKDKFGFFLQIIKENLHYYNKISFKKAVFIKINFHLTKHVSNFNNNYL